jgi:hypothetical protein
MVTNGALGICSHATGLTCDDGRTKEHAVEVFRGLTKILRASGTTLSEAFSGYQMTPGISDSELLQATMETQAALDENMKDGILDIEELQVFFGEIMPSVLKQIIEVHLATDPKATERSREKLMKWHENIKEVMSRKYR